MAKLTILESPFAPRNGVTTETHVAYARRAVLDSLLRNEAPFASHLLYTQCLNDLDPLEREIGISTNLALYTKDVCEKCVVYMDYGISSGMKQAIDKATTVGIPIEYRFIGL